MALSPQQNARTIGLVMLGAIVLVSVIFLVITWVQGDPTNHLGDNRQPSLTPSATFPTATTSTS